MRRLPPSSWTWNRQVRLTVEEGPDALLGAPLGLGEGLDPHLEGPQLVVAEELAQPGSGELVPAQELHEIHSC